MRTRSMTPPIEPEPSEAKERIIQGAISVFKKYSVDMATMRMIAKESGVSLSLLVYHFQTKDNIYQTVLDRTFDEYKRHFEHIFERLDAKPKPKRVEAVELLCELIEIAVDCFFSTKNWTGKILLYEYTYPSFHFDILYKNHIEQFNRKMANLFMTASGNDDHKTAYYQMANVFGQILGYRIRREQLMRLLEMECFSPEDLDQIKKMVIDNALFMLGVKR